MHANDLNPDLGQRRRLVNPASGGEVVLDAVPGVRYVDRDTGEPLQVTGRLLPPLNRHSDRKPDKEAT